MPQHKTIKNETDKYIDDNIDQSPKINVNSQYQVILGKLNKIQIDEGDNRYC